MSGRIVIDGDERSVCSDRADLRCAGEQRHSVSGNQLREEEIPDVSLATFHIFDKESRTGKRLACGCGGVVAYSRERPHPRPKTMPIRANRLARLDGGTNISLN